MQRSSLFRVAAAGGALVLAVSAFRAPAPRAKVYTITAHDYSYDAPARMAAGLVTLRLINKGAEWHHASLLRIDGRHTAADVAAAMKTEGPPPAWLVLVGGPNAVEPNREANATLSLKPGNYVLTCFIPNKEGKPHMALGMMRPIAVVGPESADPLPRADVTMSLVDYDFTLPATIKPGRHVIRIRNAGPQPHEVVIGKLKPGATDEDVQKWLMSSLPGEASAGELIGGLAPIAAKGEANLAIDLPAGEYLLICFVPDTNGGKPHFMHGMMKRIQVG